MSLPIYTDTDDVNSLVEYLRNKPTGATITEAKAVLKQVLDKRKISAYLAWNIIVRDGDRIKLSPRGWELARKTKTSEAIFWEVIDSIVPYRSAIEWMFHQNLDTVTSADIAAFWHEHYSEESGTENENTLKDQVFCFFRLAEGASLGTLTQGRRGQPTRFSINRSTLKSHIESGPTAPPWQEPSTETDWAPELEEHDQASIPEVTPTLPLTNNGSSQLSSVTPVASENQSLQASVALKSSERMRVFISHGRNTDFVSQVETMLELAEIESEVATKEETTAIPVPDKVFSAMRRCQAGIIIVSAEESSTGNGFEPRINENVLIEIGAAFVLYDRRVVLLWDKRLPVPSNLQGLYRCEFEGEELSWSAGMKLMKAIREFKKP